MGLDRESGRVFHELWGQAKSGVYDKDKWREMQHYLLRLCHALNRCPIHAHVQNVEERTACALCFTERRHVSP